MRNGCAPLNPMRSMIVPHAWDTDLTYDTWLDCDLPWVEVCDAVLRLPGESAGADRECNHARSKDIPVYDSVDELLDWFGAYDEATDSTNICKVSSTHTSESGLAEGGTVVNEQGGRQSHVSARLDLIPHDNELLLGECLSFGADKYGEDNWKQIPLQDNLNHAMVHLRKWLAGDRTEPHLVNTLARVNFALWHAIQNGEQPKRYIHPEM